LYRARALPRVPPPSTKVLIVRGELATPWELAPWAELPERFDVSYLLTRSNQFDADAVPLRAERVTSTRDRLPPGRAGFVLARLAGERYLADADAAYAAADVVHAEELSYWFAADAARRKRRHGFTLVQTVWETLPFLRTYRNRQARAHRDAVLAATDLFLPATERAREALLLEGVDERRILLCPPGVDVERFGAGAPAPPAEHVILSPGRLVWEKGHQDVLRAMAVLARRGVHARARITGRGPEEGRLRGYAEELGLGDRVEIGPVAYGEMPALFASASCMVLASLPSAGFQLHPFDRPRAFWEEQFGMVLAEGMAAGLDILASASGAIPEVLQGQGTLVAPGDWPELARLLADGPLARPPGERVSYPPELVRRYSTAAMAERLAAAYDGVLGSG
jgi:glycosyltransferase involved in cell wall biosynthesis